MPPPDYSAGSEYHIRRRGHVPGMVKCLELAFETLGAPQSLLDLGCGEGAGIDRCRELGIRAVGVDLAVPESNHAWFIRHDLHDALNLGISFDWVLCWEVAEHLQPRAAETLCDSLVWHLSKPAGRLFFTAAQPWQKGPGHINCQPREYWRHLFEMRGLAKLPSANLSLLWMRHAPNAPWYGRNLQIFGWA